MSSALQSVEFGERFSQLHKVLPVFTVHNIRLRNKRERVTIQTTASPRTIIFAYVRSISVSERCRVSVLGGSKCGDLTASVLFVESTVSPLLRSLCKLCPESVRLLPPAEGRLAPLMERPAPLRLVLRLRLPESERFLVELDTRRLRFFFFNFLRTFVIERAAGLSPCIALSTLGVLPVSDLLRVLSTKILLKVRVARVASAAAATSAFPAIATPEIVAIGVRIISRCCVLALRLESEQVFVKLGADVVGVVLKVLVVVVAVVVTMVGMGEVVVVVVVVATVVVAVVVVAVVAAPVMAAAVSVAVAVVVTASSTTR